jgi:uncharacterized protein YhaN
MNSETNLSKPSTRSHLLNESVREIEELLETAHYLKVEFDLTTQNLTTLQTMIELEHRRLMRYRNDINQRHLVFTLLGSVISIVITLCIVSRWL